MVRHREENDVVGSRNSGILSYPQTAAEQEVILLGVRISGLGDSATLSGQVLLPELAQLRRFLTGILEA